MAASWTIAAIGDDDAVISLLALRNLTYRPWRSVLLFLGYGMGVAVMITLLSIGEALVTQARQEKLVGGGNITVLPEGLDIEVMKTGGLGGLFFSIDHSRFIYRQVLASPRLAGVVRAVSPQIDGKLLYLTMRDGRVTPVRATGEIPSATRAVGALPAIAAGTWRDDDDDRRYTNPTRRELDDEIDHFHVPPPGVAHPESWAEWRYFNVLSPSGKAWTFISYIIAGDISGTHWGGKLGVTVRDSTGAIRRYALLVPAAQVEFSTLNANVRLGTASVTVRDDGSYLLEGSAAPERGGGAPLTLHLVVTPAPRAYFPGAALGGADLVSGYVVAGLRANASGTICEGTRCETYDGAQSYHDHNWGVWQGVTWDWGAARAGAYTILYGRVIPPASVADAPPLFVYLVDSLGFRAVFRPREIHYVDDRSIVVDGHRMRVPSSATFADVRGDDTLRVQLTIESALGTDSRTTVAQRGDAGDASSVLHPYFIQMKGTAALAGRVGGARVGGTGIGFFETYR